MALLGFNLMSILAANYYYPILLLIGVGLLGYGLGIDRLLEALNQMMGGSPPPKQNPPPKKE
jgi:hypothetical protein